MSRSVSHESGADARLRPAGRVSGHRAAVRFQSAMRRSQVLQFQGMVQGHEVRVTGDPPEGHGVLRKETHR